MTDHDVASLEIQPDIIFVGGTTDWKWATVKTWCTLFPRGAESCDGSGWFRGREGQILELVEFIAATRGLDRDECRAAAKSSRHIRDNQLVMRLETET